MAEEKKELSIEEKIANLERSMTEKDTKINSLSQENEQLKKQLNSIKLDSLTRQVEPAKEQVDEEVQFDFDI